MRKIISMLIIGLLFTACSANEKVITTQEEWDAVMDVNKYQNVRVVTNNNAPGDEMKMQTIYLGEENVIKIVDSIDEITYNYYYINNPEALSFKSVFEEADGTYITDIYEYPTLEEKQEVWQQMFTSMLSPIMEETSDFSKAVYDETKGCYCFSYDVYGFPCETELYVKNGLVTKRCETIIVDESNSLTSETNFEINSGEKLELPDFKDKVADAEAWKALFDVAKYANCEVLYESDEATISSRITNDIIEQTIHNADGEFIGYKQISRVDDKKEMITETIGETEEKTYEVEYNDELTCFEDNFALLTFEKDLASEFDQIKEVDDHYEYEFAGAGTKVLIKFYISNGYITLVDRNYEFADGSKAHNITTIDYFGQTKID